jgi:hypothetical protein
MKSTKEISTILSVALAAGMIPSAALAETMQDAELPSGGVNLKS